MNDPELSPAAAGCMLLIWQQPTDRALAGWAPYSGHNGGAPSEMQWMRDKLRLGGTERDSYARRDAGTVAEYLQREH